MQWLTGTRLMAALVALTLVMGAANLLASRQYLNNYKAGQQRQQAAQRAAARRQQAEQRAAGILIERSLCLDLGTMARIPAPPGAASANPSRAYEQAEARAWHGLYAGLECSRISR